MMKNLPKKVFTIALKLSVRTMVAFLIYIVALLALSIIFKEPERVLERLYIGETCFAFFVVYMASGLTVIFSIFLGVEPEDDSKTAKSEKVAISLKTYNELREHIEKLATDWNYKYSRVHSLDEGEVCIYIHSAGFSGIDCIVLVRVPELHQEIRGQIDEAVYDLLTAYYGKDELNDFVSMIELFCVDRITSSFRSALTNVKWKDYKFEFFPVGVSFGGKNAYIAVPGKRSKRYENMREVILRLLGIEVAET